MEQSVIPMDGVYGELIRDLGEIVAARWPATCL